MSKKISQLSAAGALAGTELLEATQSSASVAVLLSAVKTFVLNALNFSSLAGTAAISQGGTGATSAPAALTNLGAVPLAGGTMSGLLLLSADPATALGAATKQYVDAVAQGLDPKQSVRFATTANDSLSGLAARDGVTPLAGDRGLVKNQSTASQNGIYVAASGAWARALDMDAWAEVPGAFAFVEEGTVNADTGWVCTANAGGTIGSTSIAFAQFSSAGVPSAGTGLTQTGLVFSLTAPVTASLGGTGQTSYAVGDIVQADTTTSLAKLAAVATGNVLLSGGVGVVSAWGKVSLTTHVTGVLPIANGGIGSGTPSGTVLDNITGFSGIGFLKRIGTGAYGVIADPVPYLNGGTAQNLSSAWTAYTPSVASSSGTLTTTSATGRYVKMGRTVHFEAIATITTNGTGAVAINIGIPFAASAFGFYGVGRETAIAGQALYYEIAASASVALTFFHNNTYPGADGAVLKISGTYEASS